MRPMAVLIGIIMGSAVALTVSLTMSAIVFLLLPEYSARLAPERLPLLKGLLWSWSLTAVGRGSFVGELRHRRWRFAPQLVAGRDAGRAAGSTGPEAPVQRRASATTPNAAPSAVVGVEARAALIGVRHRRSWQCQPDLAHELLAGCGCAWPTAAGLSASRIVRVICRGRSPLHAPMPA